MNTPDENLPAALTHYHQAVTALLDPTPDHPDGRYQAPSNAIPGRQGAGGHHARSIPPIWIDATQILAQIDTQARKWWFGHHHTKPARKPPTDTPGQLESLPKLQWRPQDAPQNQRLRQHHHPMDHQTSTPSPSPPPSTTGHSHHPAQPAAPQPPTAKTPPANTSANQPSTSPPTAAPAPTATPPGHPHCSPT